MQPRLTTLNIQPSDSHLQQSGTEQQEYTPEQLISMVNQYFDLRESGINASEIRTQLLSLRNQSPKYEAVINSEATSQRKARGIQDYGFIK